MLNVCSQHSLVACTSRLLCVGVAALRALHTHTGTHAHTHQYVIQDQRASPETTDIQVTLYRLSSLYLCIYMHTYIIYTYIHTYMQEQLVIK